MAEPTQQAQSTAAPQMTAEKLAQTASTFYQKSIEEGQQKGLTLAQIHENTIKSLDEQTANSQVAGDFPVSMNKAIADSLRGKPDITPEQLGAEVAKKQDVVQKDMEEWAKKFKDQTQTPQAANPSQTQSADNNAKIFDFMMDPKTLGAMGPFGEIIKMIMDFLKTFLGHDEKEPAATASNQQTTPAQTQAQTQPVQPAATAAPVKLDLPEGMKLGAPATIKADALIIRDEGVSTYAVDPFGQLDMLEKTLGKDDLKGDLQVQRVFDRSGEAMGYAVTTQKGDQYMVGSEAVGPLAVADLSIAETVKATPTAAPGIAMNMGMGAGR